MNGNFGGGNSPLDYPQSSSSTSGNAMEQVNPYAPPDANSMKIVQEALKKLSPEQQHALLALVKAKGSGHDTINALQMLTSMPTSDLPVSAQPASQATTSATPAGPAPIQSPPAAKRGRKKARTDAEGDGELYCLCRTGASQFMIGCDKCGEWYHGNCIEVSRSEARNIENYFCPPCCSQDPSLKIVYKKKESEALVRCLDCVGCARFVDAGSSCSACDAGECKPHACIEPLPASAANTQQHKTSSRGRKEKHRVVSSSDDDDAVYRDGRDISDQLRSRAAGGGGVVLEKGKRGRKKGWRKDKAGSDASPVKEKKKEAKKDDTLIDPVAFRRETANRTYTQLARSRHPGAAEEPKQCLGPGCILSARIHSKYCSDDCGRKLAEVRLRTILPGRVAAFWERLPSAVTRSAEQMSEATDWLRGIEEELNKIKVYVLVLTKWIDTVAGLEPVEDDEPESDVMMACPVCSLEFNARQLPRHVEKCFVKAEKQIVYGTSQQLPFNPEGIFCETFHPKTKTYCRRLRVMCAEHYKGDLEARTKVCGCPRVWSDVQSYTVQELFNYLEKMDQVMDDGFCLQSQKKCIQHHRWIQTVLGILDTERVNLLTKHDEFTDKRLWLQQNNAARGDVVSLLCNQTKTFAPSPPTDAVMEEVKKEDEDAPAEIASQ